MTMGKVEKLEHEVEALSSEELAQFRAWFLEFDWAAWDAQLESDVRAGRLDALAEKALADHAARKTTRL
jgi:outer membrane murein-binding lipoprotein Lpp